MKKKFKTWHIKVLLGLDFIDPCGEEWGTILASKGSNKIT